MRHVEDRLSHFPGGVNRLSQRDEPTNPQRNQETFAED